MPNVVTCVLQCARGVSHLWKWFVVSYDLNLQVYNLEPTDPINSIFIRTEDCPELTLYQVTFKLGWAEGMQAMQGGLGTPP